jgi:hypothetical protein
MFLPVLLVRDYGIWGLVVFGVPNVVGAGAMGWVLKNGASERIVERHRGACVAFSLITIAFQRFFLAWLPLNLLDRLETTGHDEGGFSVLGWFLAATCLALIGLGAIVHKGAMRAVGFLVLAISVWAGVILLRGAGLQAWKTPGASALVGLHADGLVWLAPVCIFGFALCPYLDLTFHRARQSLSAAGARGAFSLGFGVFFLAMILITLLVAPLVLGLLGMIPASAYRWIPVWPLFAHLILQLVYTIIVHAVEVMRARRAWIAAFAVAGLVGLAMLARELGSAEWRGMLAGEVIYRCFMSFYGLVFPAYVWLCMIPTRDGHSGIEGAAGRRKLAVLGVACALAAPCYWMGFIERAEWWLAPGLGVVLLARLVVRGKPRPAADTPS